MATVTNNITSDHNVRLAEVLLQGLVKEGPMSIKEIKRIAKEEGISHSALLKAKAKLGIKTRKSKFTRHLNEKCLKGETLWEKKDQEWEWRIEGDDALRLMGEMYPLIVEELQKAREAIAAGKPYTEEDGHRSWDDLIKDFEEKLRRIEDWHRAWKDNPHSMYYGH
jgi:hypothetical protein